MQTAQPQQQQQQQYKNPPGAPPLPDPDYSLSESDTEEDNSVRMVRANLKKVNGGSTEGGVTTNGGAVGKVIPVNPGMAAETSGNSNTSGSSSGSSSIPHSFSVEEIQKIRTKLKSSKSYPNDFLRQQNAAAAAAQQQQHEAGGPQDDAGDNSSSGVSSDQEVTVTCNEAQVPPPPSKPMAILEQKKMAVMITPSKVPVQLPEVRSDEDDGDQSPSPPATGFQRHNSLTRKQAATIAAQRAKAAAAQNIQQRHAVTLATLPPPIEADSDEADGMGPGAGAVLPPPAEFSDSVVGGCAGHSQPQHHHHHHGHGHHGGVGGGGGQGQYVTGHNPNCKRVRIVGAVPKINRLNSQ